MEKGITITTWEWLADIGDISKTRYSLHESELFDLSLLYKRLLELERSIKVVLDRLLATTSYDHDIGDTSTYSFFYKILDDRLIDDREHLLRLGLGSREESSTESCSRDDTFAYSVWHRYRLSLRSC